jgi:hypothetical protein
MKFKLVPILDTMETFYKLPKTKERFEKYIAMLQGTSRSDMSIPISGYNPMAKGNVLLKIQELKKMNAEKIMEDELNKINDKINDNRKGEFEVVINISDDIGGEWSNFHTTSYSSKFKLSSLVNRSFCTPYFWTSENYSEEMIAQRTKEYVFRTLFWLNNETPKSLEDFCKQEVFVQSNSNENIQKTRFDDFTKIQKFYTKNLKSEDYNLIFNFFYGDGASNSLGYSSYGMNKNEGFEYSKFLSKKCLIQPI